MPPAETSHSESRDRPAPRGSPWLYGAELVLLASGYVVLGKIGMRISFVDGVAAPIWPPAGLGLAVLLLRGVRYWPAITVGAAVGAWTGGLSVFVALALAVGPTLEGVVGWYLLRRLRFQNSMGHVRDAVAFVVVAVALAPMVNAAFGVTIQELFGLPMLGSVWVSWWTWYVGDALGIMVVGGALLTWLTPRPDGVPGSPLELVALPVALLGVALMAFGDWFSLKTAALPLAYLPFPLLGWAVFRFKLRGATLATFVITAIATIYTAQGVGPFVRGPATESLLLTWTFLAVFAMTGLISGAVVTQWESAKGEVRRQSEFALQVMSALRQGVTVTDADGRFEYVNPAYAHMVGRLPESLLGRRPQEITPLDELPAPTDPLAGGEVEPVSSYEARIERPDASSLFVLVTGTPRWRDGRACGAFTLFTDITERRRAREALRASEARFRTMFQRHSAVMLLIDAADGTIVDANAAAERFYGYRRDRLRRMHIDEISNGSSAAQRPVGSNGPRHIHLSPSHRLASGEVREVEIQMSPVKYGEGELLFAIINDITDRKHLEAQLLQAQKMEAVGQLAGGIAHDFNNLVTAMLGYGEFALAGLESDHPARGNIEQVIKAAERAAGLTGQLLAFARRQMVEPKVIVLNDLVVNMERMLRRVIGEDIALVSRADPRLHPVRVDPGQFEQVLINLAVNARDAMPHGGTLTIETGNVELPNEESEFTWNHAPGPYATLTVRDTGEGMDEATRARIFEPFFTTKKPGEGTGLGLSTSYGLIKQAGGHIQVWSGPGAGTTFKIYLPAVGQAPKTAPNPALVAAGPGGDETILLVEDEEEVRSLVQEVLGRHGYTVLPAADGEEALRIAGEHETRIHLLLTDVVLPGIGGGEVAQRLCQSRPDLHVLYMSGYTGDSIVRQGVMDDAVAFMGKPFSPRTLARKVREVLDDAPTPRRAAHRTARRAGG